jgi:hypothetical protein
MVGVLIGFSIAGILGSLLAVPFMATGRELIAYAYAKVLLRDPFPPPDASEPEKISTIERLKVILSKTTERIMPSQPESAVETTAVETAETAVADNARSAAETDA